MTEGFLLLTLFFPRIGLLYWYTQGWMPPNPTSYMVDAILSILAPRILILMWFASQHRFDGWFIAHLIFALAIYLKGSSTTYSRTTSN